jgi:hypothetical protein
MPDHIFQADADAIRELGVTINSAHYCASWVHFHIERGGPESSIYDCAIRTARYGRSAISKASVLKIELT